VAGFLRDGRPAPGERATNGAAMRAAAIGWAEAEPRRRRELSSAFARTTHAAPEAVEAACAVADLAAAALAGSLPEPAGWDPPAEGVSMDALDTLAAVRHVVAAHHDPAAAMRAAVALGGDTDTVAAIAGGILGCRRAGSELGVPWLHRVELPSPDRVEAIARGLAERRTRG
jgi:ADP-ribosylglycohydrolase